MHDVYRHIFKLQQDSTALCAELFECLNSERSALIALDTERLIGENLRKESLGKQLASKRAELSQLLQSESCKEGWRNLTEEERTRWTEGQNTWNQRWTQMRQRAEENQRLIRHSLKNLNLIVDNLKRLFGESQLYSARGTKVAAQRQGKVVEGRY